MPIYEYKCNNCGEDFSLIQSITRLSSDLKCPNCNSADIKKTISAFSCLFSGSSAKKTSDLSYSPSS
ncbi:MAG: zinc ribbon domain-containing protein [Thermodesulfovibrionales bacterium]|nr:zinc ribbon domain-containing protein [Thermodesulfovibrionales bacterium]